MSQSPDSPTDDAMTYAAGWSAISRLIRQGFSWSGHERNVALLNLGDGPFADVSALSGFDLADDGRALVSVDWDFDGDLDLFQSSRSGPRLRFLENVHSEAPGQAFGQVSGQAPGWAPAWVALRLAGGGGNTGAVGARVLVFLEGVEHPLVRTRRVGEGFLAQSSAWLNFGLGEGVIERVEVRWPGGVRESFEGVRAGRFHILVQGSGAAREWSPPSVSPAPPGAASGAPLVEKPTSRAARVVLQTPVPMPRIEAVTADGRSVGFLGIGPAGPQGSGRPLLLNVWASWCAPCVEELSAFALAKDKLSSRLDVVALTVDDKGSEAAALLERIG